MKITLPKGTKVEIEIIYDKIGTINNYYLDLTDSQAEELLKQLLPEEYLMVSKEEYKKMFPNKDK